MSSNLA